MIRKLIAECLGTMLLVFFGCGVAVLTGGNILLTAPAFGLVLLALVYTIGDVSGCHINPAVSIAMLIDRRMSVVECIEYIFMQVLGGIIGAELVGVIFQSYENFGANAYGTLSAMPTTTVGIAILIEVLLTFTFVSVVLSASAKKNNNAGIAIGLTLTLVHILGISFTGTSVNPARSIGPALLTGGEYLSQLWVFIVAPMAGGILAALFYKFVLKTKEEILVEKVEEIVEIKEEKPVKKAKTTIKKKETAKKTKKGE